ncbi:TPA: GtrA family protein [Pseudomonas putida]|uniref:GtrA family protein n=1 Tax=Pseudomonas putida TaxID=303 RepID=UPI002363B9BF|nr:GtrA family protein [Pseudomonas putida]MDD2153920.1 GtrA family protein [Pseudomonas putida]HDS1681857.1 GtrA family protein [Pseudomonas putida]
MRRFARYGLVGIGNTLVHWGVFLSLHLALGLSQARSNFSAFVVASSLSYLVNARYTFAVRPTGRGYIIFLFGMGSFSLVLGAVADWADLWPGVILLTFSAASLVVGYCFTRGVVFRTRAP